MLLLQLINHGLRLGWLARIKQTTVKFSGQQMLTGFCRIQLLIQYSQLLLQRTQLDVLPHQLRLQADLYLTQERLRRPFIGIRRFNAVANTSPQINFPADIQATLVRCEWLAQYFQHLIFCRTRQTHRVNRARIRPVFTHGLAIHTAI